MCQVEDGMTDVKNLTKYKNKNERIRLWIKVNYNAEYIDLRQNLYFVFTQFAKLQNIVKILLKI